jgi:hypothetical protein
MSMEPNFDDRTPNELEIERLEEICQKYGGLILEKNARIAELEQEADDDAILRGHMRRILVETANVLKGDPGPLKQHSWHDLADWARLKCADIRSPKP